MTNIDWYTLIVYAIIVAIVYFVGVYWIAPDKEQRRRK